MGTNQCHNKTTTGQPGSARARLSSELEHRKTHRIHVHDLELWKKLPTLGISLAKQPSDPQRSQEKPRQVNQGHTGRDKGLIFSCNSALQATRTVAQAASNSDTRRRPRSRRKSQDPQKQSRGADRGRGENLKTLGISLAAKTAVTEKVTRPPESVSRRRPWSRRKSQDPRNQSRGAGRGHGENHKTLGNSLAAQTVVTEKNAGPSESDSLRGPGEHRQPPPAQGAPATSSYKPQRARWYRP